MENIGRGGIEVVVPAAAIAEMKAMTARQRAAADLARPALERLVSVMRHETGQGYKLRALLYTPYGTAKKHRSASVADWIINSGKTCAR